VLTLDNKKLSYGWQIARCRFVKLLRYCSTFLSEYVDKRFTRDYNVILYLSIFNSFWVIRCLSQCVSPKISIFTTFLFALGTPLWQSRKTLHKWKDNSVFAKSLAACTHLSSTVSQLFEPQVQKIAILRTAAHIFVSPGDAPALITQYVAWMEREFNACQTPRSMYPSIFNSFRVIRCLSQCVSPKIAIFTHFGFPWGRPWGNHVNVIWMEREFDAYKLSRRMCPSNCNSFWDTARYWSKIVNFFIPPCIRRPRQGVHVGIALPRSVWKN